MNSYLIALAAAAALGAAPALAQGDSAAHHPDAAAAKPMDMSKMTPEEMHKHCAMLMGAKMQGRRRHDHTAEKLGHAPAPATPPTEAEMKAMHEKCAAMMAEKKPDAPAKP